MTRPPARPAGQSQGSGQAAQHGERIRLCHPVEAALRAEMGKCTFFSAALRQARSRKTELGSSDEVGYLAPPSRWGGEGEPYSNLGRDRLGGGKGGLT